MKCLVGAARKSRGPSHEYAWHCLPFTEGAQYGLELFYPHYHEARVIARDGVPQFEGDFGPPPEQGEMWPPFRNFGNMYYTYQLSLDLDPGPGMAVRFETHPRFFTDTTNTVPVAVPALIRNWWPMTFFLVFKTPAEGQTHIFRGGEPFVQAIVIPEECRLALQEMTEEEAAQRELQSRRIYKSRHRQGLPSQILHVAYRSDLGDAQQCFEGDKRTSFAAAPFSVH